MSTQPPMAGYPTGGTYPNAPTNTPAAPGKQPRPKVDTGLYKGSGTMGAALEAMWGEGRRVIKDERQRMLVNRNMYLGKQYLQTVAGVVRTLAPASLLRSGRRRDTINRARQFIDGRVAMLTRDVPPFEVMAENLDADDMTAARLGEKYVRYQWGAQDGWNVQGYRVMVALAGEQDGVCFGRVDFDPWTGATKDVPYELVQGKWEPVTDRSRYEALKAQDPAGEALWRNFRVPVGKVRLRMVRAGRLSVDPMMTTDWADARWVVEWDTWSMDRARRAAGKPLEELRRQSAQSAGQPNVTATSGRDNTTTIGVEDGAGERTLSGRNTVKVYELHRLPDGPNGDWPRGAHVVWLDGAANAPIVAEPYDDDEELPYGPYAPKPDALHILRSRGTMDELGPIQTTFNRTISAIGEWLDRLARPPLLITGGSLRSNRPIYSENPLVEVNPGMSDPRWMQVPGEPVAVMTHYLGFLLSQMAEIAVQHDVTRGAPPGGPDSGVALGVLDRNNEVQLSGTEQQQKQNTEWAVSRALRLTARNVTIPQLVTAPGVDDEDEFLAFTGEKLRGCTRFIITGSILPRSREQMMQVLFNAVGLNPAGFDITAYLPEIIRGEIDGIIERERADERKQSVECRELAAFGRIKDRDAIWEAFTHQRDAYLQAVASLQAQGDPRPDQTLAGQGIKAPTITNMVKNVVGTAQQAEAEVMRVPGLPDSYQAPVDFDLPRIPVLEDFDVDVKHLKTLDDYCKGDAYTSLHPLVQQLLREHRQEHVQRIERRKQEAQAAMLAAQAPPMPAGAPGGRMMPGGPPGPPAPSPGSPNGAPDAGLMAGVMA